MAAKFKVGDRVRVIDDSGGGKLGDVATVVSYCNYSIDGRYFYQLDGLSGGTRGLYEHRLEPLPVAEATGTDAGGEPKFKVGDAIRHKELNYVGTVKEVYEDGTVETFWTAEGWGARDPVEDIEPTTLTIQAGKFYKTRDGRKVGPMEKDAPGYLGAHNGDHLESFEIDGGANCLDSERDLIAEWADEPSEVFDELERWMTDNPQPANDNSTAGFTIPLCELEAEPDLTAIGKAYADGYAAGLAARQVA